MDIFNLNGHPHVELCDLLKLKAGLKAVQWQKP